MKTLLFLTFAAALFAGQSLVPATNKAQNLSVTAQSGDFFEEFTIDVLPANLTTSPTFMIANGATGVLLELINCGTNCYSYQLYDSTNTGNSAFPLCQGGLIGGTHFLAQPAVSIRYNHHTTGTKTDDCTLYNPDGSIFDSGSGTHTGQSANSAGTSIGGGADGEHIAFFRICTGATMVPNGKIPTTAGGCPVGTLLVEWKFDGSLADASTNHFDATMNSGSAAYATSLYQGVQGVAKTIDAPFWSTWLPMRAGHTGQFDCTSSFSQADASNAVSCFWQMIYAPAAAALKWSSHSTTQPIISGLVTGPYTAQLTVSDVAGNSNVSTFKFGAVATDNKDVVVQANPAADQLYGPMLRLGKSPWAARDKLLIDAVNARYASYGSPPPGTPPTFATWETALPGTISYPFSPITGTTLNGMIDASTLSVTVTDATKLDLATFPTVLLIGTLGSLTDDEEILVCSASGNVLTVCYDGRGYHFGAQFHQVASSHNSGVVVTQQKITGSSTSLLSTFNPLGTGWVGVTMPAVTNGTCSVTAGSANISATSANWATIVTSPSYPIGQAIRVAGTHSSTAFVYQAYISAILHTVSVSPVSTGSQIVTPASMTNITNGMVLTIQNQDGTLTETVTVTAVTGSTFTGTFAFSHLANFNIILPILTANRVFPSDGDSASGLTCTVFKPEIRNIVVHYVRCGSGTYTGCVAYAYPQDGYIYMKTDACYSDTECYVYEGFDAGAVHPNNTTCLSSTVYGTGKMQCGVHVSYMDNFNYVGDDSGKNFYDEAMAWQIGYLQSGAQIFNDAFEAIQGKEGSNNNGYFFYPEYSQGDVASQPRRNSVLGGWGAYLLDGKTSNLSALRKMANNTISSITNFGSVGGCNQDSREGVAYPLEWVGAAALWDPNAVSLGYVTQLGNWYTNYSPCANTTGSALLINSWANGSLWNTNQTPALTVAMGSRIATGTAISTKICGITPQATGTATVTANSDVVTGTGFVTGGGKIMFEDSVLGLITFNYIFDSSTQVHLGGQYPGANASGVTWIIETDAGAIADSMLVFASSASDPQLQKQWGCVWNNSGQITLDRNWDAAETTVWGWRGSPGGVGPAGFGAQPFVEGIMDTGLRISSLQSGSLGTNFATLGTNHSVWQKTYGFDAITGGVAYARIFPGCEPDRADSSQPQNFGNAYRVPECIFNSSTVAQNFSKQTARVNSAEMSVSAYFSYLLDTSAGNKAFWDTFYANIWDIAPYTTAGFTSDGLGSENCGLGQDQSAGKWSGFCHGHGMSHLWPAVRLGGVDPAVTRTVYQGFTLPTTGTHAIFTVTAPSGAVTQTTCSATAGVHSSCALSMDARQGDHLVTAQYLDVSNKVLATSDPSRIIVQ